MKVCLISAPTANQFDTRAVGEAEAARIMGELAPVGILSLAAVLEAKGLQPEVVDLNRVYYQWLQSANPEIDFCRFAGAHLAQRECGFFGFSTVCSSYPLTLRIAAEVKRLHPESVVALGGPQASVVDVQTMRAYPFIDLVVRGEAEQTLPDVVDALASHTSPKAIPGTTFRQHGELVRNADPPLILDLDSLPFPAFHLFPDVRYCSHFPLELGRGCPFACTFCSTNDFFRRRFRLKTPARMIAEMRRVKESYGINSFELVHDMFTVDRKRVIAFCEALLVNNEDFYWGCSARTDCVDEELIALMAKAGCRGIFFGIESGSARMQKIIDKGLELNDSAARVNSCDKFKIKTAVSLIAGFPDETMEDLSATAAFFMDSLRYDHADPQLSILAPLSDTPIQKQYKDSLLLNDDVADMSYRGWSQQAEDYEMIAGHPEIFSSFYSVPMPSVDREFLKELRDFLLNGMRTFRWLFLGLHQDSGDIVRVFQQWRDWRRRNDSSFDGSGRTSYYANDRFRCDFLEFVGSRYIPAESKAPVAITALLDCELAVRQENPDTYDHADDHREEPISPQSCPRLRHGVSLMPLNVDYQEMLRRLREKRSLNDVPSSTAMLLIRKNAARQAELIELSPLSAELLALCDGDRTVSEIAAELWLRNIGVAGIPLDKLCTAGIELLRQQRLVTCALPQAALA
jgi:radical SAM superfamily enzyme YgiQ (UPF0313 family)